MSPSPRSSVDTPISPSSPFLHHLSQRFRKGSTVSRASSLNSGSPTHAAPVHGNGNNTKSVTSPTEGVDTARSAKKYLLAVVRNDWEYPGNFGQAETADTSQPLREPVEYRLRTESASDAEMQDTTPTTTANTNNPYRFDNPESIGVSVAERKRKRTRLIEEELEWNEGLRAWMAQRDAWTGAVSRIPQSSTAEQSVDDGMTRGQATASPASSRHREASTSTNGSSDSDRSTRHRKRDESIPVGETSMTSIDHNDGQLSSIDPTQKVTTITLKASLDGPHLPIYPPLFPSSNTLRSRIKPSVYPAIYSKVVVQNMTPNVPIPLTHMIGALVDGWRSEGNWPPQSTWAEPGRSLTMTTGRKKNRRVESAFGRWKGEQEERKQALRALNQGQLPNGQAEDGTERSEKRGLRLSISGAVKKVLGKVADGHVHDQEDSDVALQRLGLTFEEEANTDDVMNSPINHQRLGRVEPVR